MKRVYYTIVLLLVGNIAFAQKGFHTVGAGVELGLPIGDFGQGFGIGFGATGKAFYGITDIGDITGTLGYLRFGMKESSDLMKGSMGMVPIVFGYRHDFGGLYGEPQVGLTVVKSKVTIKDDFGIGLSGIGGSASTTKASFGLGGGYVFGNWDLGARFQIIDSMNFLGVRLGYNFSLGR
ncbi:hypothetical protein [Sphingobacterium paucimobilis]|uniref:Outer membrane protein beta-barrel domain-containing protein n=1 Tax=Sphingobacterium paucimobilis HER1398 TaxID=1346330 RepID=U2HYQ6_9SPHI|nr:hypothetical protein [Sphingobacterium paucimobilis]ERJ60682.1 hypothetical protein M472_18145 [Sphingobacterium paucimobilis HER1398]